MVTNSILKFVHLQDVHGRDIAINIANIVYVKTLPKNVYNSIVSCGDEPIEVRGSVTDIVREIMAISGP